MMRSATLPITQAPMAGVQERGPLPPTSGTDVVPISVRTESLILARGGRAIMSRRG